MGRLSLEVLELGLLTSKDNGAQSTPLTRGHPLSELVSDGGENETLAGALDRPTHTHSEGAQVGGREWGEEWEQALHENGADEEPFGAEAFGCVACKGLRPEVPPEEGREDGALVLPVVGLRRKNTCFCTKTMCNSVIYCGY